MTNRISLHTWTVDTTSLEQVLQAAAKAGYDGVELRYVDFERGESMGKSDKDVVAMVRASGLAVSTLATMRGWMWAEGERLDMMIRRLHWSCETALQLGTDMIISPVDPATGEIPQAIERTRKMAEIADGYKVKLAIQMNSWAQQLNRLDLAMEVIEGADHPNVGYLLDTYHLQRSGFGGRGFDRVRPEKIFHVQVSDVPDAPRMPGVPLDRQPIGKGVIPFDQVFGLLAEKGFSGWVVYEVPNPALWARDPYEVAKEGKDALDRLLREAGPAH